MKAERNAAREFLSFLLPKKGVILRICFGFYGVDWNRAAWRSGPRAEVMALQVQRARMGEAGLSEKVSVEIPRAILAAESGT